jgi:hypothetical protein
MRSLNIWIFIAGMALFVFGAQILLRGVISLPEETSAQSAATSTLEIAGGVTPAAASPPTRRPEFRPGTEASRRGVELRKVSARLALLEESLARLDQRVEALVASVSSLSDRDDAEATSVESDAEDAWQGESALPAATDSEAEQAEQELATSQQMATVESSFWSEPVDPDWSHEAGDTIRRALNRGLPGPPAAVNMECRSTLCRVELQQPDFQAAELASASLLAQVSASLNRMAVDHVDQGGGWTTTIIYLVRHGQG